MKKNRIQRETDIISSNQDTSRSMGEKLQEKQELLKSIFDSSPDAITIADLNLNIMDCNQAALDLFKYSSKNEIMGKNVFDFISKKEHPKVKKDLGKILKNGFIKNAEYTCLSKTGDEIIAFISTSIVKDEKDNPLYFVGIIKDITKIKLAKQRLQVIFDGISDGILIVDKNYKVLRVNLGILEMFNKKNFPDVLGEKCYLEFFKNKDVCADCLAMKTLKNGKTYSNTRIFRGKENERILEISTFPIKDEREKVIEVIEYIKDATDRVKLENQLIAQDKMAAIGELASGVAHEIRNPLGNISAAAQYCLHKYELPESVKKYIKMVLKNSENAARVIRNLLTFSKNKIISSYNFGDISEIIKNTCNLLMVRIQKQRVKLILRMADKIPKILVDEKRLEEALSNIILNSLDAMPRGGRLTITCYPDFKSNHIVLSFLDTGKGIPQEKINKIFVPFFTTKKDGVGLGLCLVLQIIREHKGTIKVESKIDQGTEVVIRLPISK